MATRKQRDAVNFLVGTGGNVTKAMRDAKYAPATYNTPQKLTESKAFPQLCKEAGLTDDLILKALSDDIKKKPRRRIAELNLAAEIRGLKKPQKAPDLPEGFDNLEDDEVIVYAKFRRQRISETPIPSGAEDKSAGMDSGQSDTDGKGNTA